jgi:hypothetical protein
MCLFQFQAALLYRHHLLRMLSQSHREVESMTLPLAEIPQAKEQVAE